jgi:hypothetical protein
MLEAEIYAQLIMRQHLDGQSSVRAQMLREAQLLRAAKRQARREPAISLPRWDERVTPIGDKPWCTTCC